MRISDWSSDVCSSDLKHLFKAFIALIAGAIDAKSPYTGGHCARVPELTKMLAAAAVESVDGPFRDFTLSEDEWDAVHVAAWLHDCGKITPTDFVIDKATQMETRSAARRGGKEGDSTCRSRWTPDH